MKETWQVMAFRDFEIDMSWRVIRRWGSMHDLK